MAGYEKDAPMFSDLDATTALTHARNGFKISREAWSSWEYLAYADGGNFRLNKEIMGDLEPFFVKRSHDHKFRVYLPLEEDLHAKDWTVFK